jgi:hypothetical protein
LIKPTDIFTINITLKIEGKLLVEFENYLYGNFEVIGFRILPDTEKLYEEDDMFKKLVKLEKEARLAKEKYINAKN